MKKLLSVIYLLACCSFIYAQAEEKHHKEDMAKINDVLDKYLTANATQNIKHIEEIWAIDEDVEAFGTAAGERVKGWDAIRRAFIRQFTTFTDTYISARDRSIHIDDSGNFAWVSQMLNYNFLLEGQQIRNEGVRYTAVLKKIDGQWKIVQMHLSLPH